jgi:hypothetical protein
VRRTLVTLVILLTLSCSTHPNRNLGNHPTPVQSQEPRVASRSGVIVACELPIGGGGSSYTSLTMVTADKDTILLYMDFATEDVCTEPYDHVLSRPVTVGDTVTVDIEPARDQASG